MKYILSGVASLLLAASVLVTAETVEDRVKPVGDLCMEGEDCAAAPAGDAAGAGGARSGEDIYKSKCTTCHATGAANAPKLGDVAAWAPRIAKGVDVLYVSAISGFNGMPAKGLCFDCSDDDLKATVDYMINNSK
ncbi:cytochrome c5 family protein [Teredinibacter sp. KSP-S5-2]|nr:cytochrome c5 family protein [Teredinibacter sp. KSP-S5-2]WNO09017.1 cytochrome c5 family protein [Teredinibacter sp. KSP-S5-2]